MHSLTTWSVLKFALAAAAGSAQASFISNDLSFGQSGKISPNGRGVPNFFLSGNPAAPEILSNKIILTPPAPGNQRGAAWGEKVVDLPVWTVDLEFRATGPERGAGNLALWYIKDGQAGGKVGVSSIYTAGKFDGLAIVVDTYGGSGGTVRGFLNDGSTNFKDHHSVDSLAFGHCSYSYRNLGRPSQLKLEHTGKGLKVSVDGNLCFESSKIILPRGNHLGISAASAETPDSFEVFKLTVSSDTPQADTYIASYETPDSSDQIPAEDANTKFADDPDLVPADSIDQSKQFQDLHNRLQAIMKHISAFQRDMNQYKGASMQRHNELKSLVVANTGSSQTQKSDAKEFPFAQINQMEKKMLDMDKKLEDILKQVEDPKRWHDLHEAVRDQHNEIFRHLPEKIAMHIPNPGLIVFFLVLLQLILMASYMAWKKRMASMPKKYL